MQIFTPQRSAIHNKGYLSFIAVIRTKEVFLDIKVMDCRHDFICERVFKKLTNL